MGFSSGIVTGIMAMLFMVMLIVPTAIHFVTTAKPAKPVITNHALYNRIGALEIEIYGQTQECDGSPWESGITSLERVMPDVWSPEYQKAVYGYGHENCQYGNCGFIDEDGRPW